MAHMVEVPRRISEVVRDFCRGVVAEAEPTYLAVTPFPEDVERDCFMNVERHIADDGGSIQHGWRIWEWPNTMIEAEFHAVWRKPAGELVDVTPLPNRERILFLPDPERVWEGRQVNNIRKPLLQNPLVEEFIRLANERFEILNSGERAEMNGTLAFNMEEAQEFEEQLKLSKAERRRLMNTIRRGAEIEQLISLCPCGSFVRYYRCCGMK
jgi:hypothetical protein